MLHKRAVKRALRQIGLFPLARATFRRLSPSHRRERQFNTRFFGSIVRRGDLCFDVGANLGQTSEVLAGLNAKVVAVEPNPLCHPVLDFHFRANPNVRIVSKAVGGAAGNATLHFHGTDSTASMRDDWPHGNDQATAVEVTTLDALIEQFGVPAFLKVDVEGFEVEVFKGLHHPVRSIYFEMHAAEAGRAREILRLLSDIGPIEGVNAVSGDNSRWLLGDWVRPEAFLGLLGKAAVRHANVVVRMTCPQRS
jgi:FkbM family methyltransferase